MTDSQYGRGLIHIRKKPQRDVPPCGYKPTRRADRRIRRFTLNGRRKFRARCHACIGRKRPEKRHARRNSRNQTKRPSRCDARRSKSKACPALANVDRTPPRSPRLLGCQVRTIGEKRVIPAGRQAKTTVTYMKVKKREKPLSALPPRMRGENESLIKRRQTRRHHAQRAASKHNCQRQGDQQLNKRKSSSSPSQDRHVHRLFSQTAVRLYEPL